MHRINIENQLELQKKCQKAKLNVGRTKKYNMQFIVYIKIIFTVTQLTIMEIGVLNYEGYPCTFVLNLFLHILMNTQFLERFVMN